MGYSADRRKELGIGTGETLSYSQRRRKELETEDLAKQKGTTVDGLERAKYANQENARKEQKLKELNTPISPEQEADTAIRKIKDKPWYVPKGVAVSIENVKLSPKARKIYAEKSEEKKSKSAKRAAGNAFVDSLTLGALSTAEKTTHKKYGVGADEFLKQKAENKANHPTATTVGTVGGYLLPGAGVEKLAGKALKPLLGKVGSNVAQKAITGAVTGGGMELAEGTIRGQSAKDIAKRTAVGAGFGAAGDVAFYGAGKGISSIANKIKAGKVLTTAEKEIVKNTPELLPKLAKQVEMPTIPKVLDDVSTPPKQANTPIGDDIYQRIEEPNIGRATVDKPQGIYTSPSKADSPHKGLGGDTFYWKRNKDANVLELNADMFTTNRGLVGESAGVATARKFLGDTEVTRLMKLSKEELANGLSSKYPNVEWNKYYDQQELVEGYAGLLARENGYDAINAIDPDDRNYDEFVALTDKAMTNYEKPSVKANVVAETKPKLEPILKKPQTDITNQVGKQKAFSVSDYTETIKNPSQKSAVKNQLEKQVKYKRVINGKTGEKTATYKEYIEDLAFKENTHTEVIEKDTGKFIKKEHRIYREDGSYDMVNKNLFDYYEYIKGGELELPKTTVADQTPPMGATLSYKPEPSLKTDLPKPSAPILGGALPTPSNKVVMDTPKAKSNFKQSMSDLRTKVVDKSNPIVKFSKLAKDDTGILASNTANANGTVDNILQNALTDRQGKKIGSSLKEVAEQIPQGKEKDFWEYMSQRHNIDRAREGKNVIANYTPEMSAEAVKKIESANPTWKTTGDNMTGWIDNFMREWGVNAGTVDSEVYDQLRNTYKSYFPTQREFSQLEKSIPSDVRKQFVDSASPVKKATGSERDIHNPLSNIMNLVDRTVKTARYNEVGQSLLNSVRKQSEKLRPLAEVITPKDGMFSNVDNIVTVLENGKPVYLQINDKALLDSLKGLPKMVNNAQAMRKISNVYKSLITTKNPLFAIRNMARDIPTAYVYGSESNPVKFVGGLLKAGKDVVTDSDNLQRYKAMGGGGANFLAGNADNAAKSLLKKPNLLQKVGSSIETFNNLTETAPRLAEFNRILDKTGDVQKALAAANDVTVNFSRGGNVTKSVDPFVPYLNAGVQGLDKFFRQVKNKPLQTIAKSGVAITVPEVGLYLLNKDNPDYQALDNRTKDTYFLIPKGDGTFTKIPKSRELGVLFGSLFQRITRATAGDKEAFKGYGNALATSFAPSNPFENNIFAPLTLNLATNKDFAGRAIVPMGMQMDKRSKYLQYDEKTTEIAKAIGKLAADATGGEGLSPKQIDYVIKSYTGIIGQLGIPLATKGGSPTKAVTSQFIADPLYSSQVVQDFYDNYTKVQRKAADKNILDKIPSKLLTPEESVEGKFRKASSQISELNKQIKAASGDEKAIRELKKQIVAIAKATNDMLK